MNNPLFNPQKYSLKTLEIISFFLASLLGVLFHFVYEWTGNQLTIGLFFPVNESTWEHLKLIFFPIMIVSLLEYYIGKLHNPDFICIKLNSALIGMVTTIVLFYTYSGVLGITIDWFNIVIYFIAMFLAYLYSYRKLQASTNAKCTPSFCLGSILFITLLFMIFTIFPPNIGLFRKP